MSRLVALALALVFAAGLVIAPDAMAQASKSTKDKGTAAEKKDADKKEAAKPAGAKLDINTASEAELKELPGIGDAYAKKIVDNRPYKRKDEIVKKAGVPKATYDKIKEQIIAHQVKEDAKAAASPAITGAKKK